MKKSVFGLLMAAFLAVLSFGYIAAETTEPIPIKFRPHGNGQFIYCNNPEFIKPSELMSVENATPMYMMKNEDLGPDTYTIFFCFYNWTKFDVEPDVEFVSDGDAVVTINSVGYSMPKAYEYWDCIGVWSDFMDMNIRTINNYEEYVPFKGETPLPKTINLSNSNDWVSKYIYNYDVLKPHVTFNMLVNFTIESGKVDVNLGAQKHYGIVGDRSWVSKEFKPAKYVNDLTVKGIDKRTLPIVETDCDIVIDKTMENGKNLDVKIFNQYHNNGNVAPYWVTNINPTRDGNMFTKNIAASSDMLKLEYKDDEKLKYYGKNVPMSERDNIWRMDIYHNNTLAYEPGMPWEKDDRIPNSYLGETLDRFDSPNYKMQFNIGNFGVTNRYNLTITNNDNVERSFNYLIEASITSDIVIVRDENAVMLNPYTLEPENAYALCKGINDKRIENCMFSAMIKPGETKKYTVDVILPTNTYGGQLNIFRVDDHKYLKEKPATEFPEYTEFYKYDDVFHDNGKPMKWEKGELFEFSEMGEWEKIELDNTAKEAFSQRTKEFRTIKIPGGYAARFASWDILYPYIQARNEENKIHIFDENFVWKRYIEFPGYIHRLAVIDEALWVLSDQAYSSKDFVNFKPTGTQMPIVNSKSVLMEKDGKMQFKKGNEYFTVEYEAHSPWNVKTAGDIFYFKKYWKPTYTDLDAKNIISASVDGIVWRDFVLPDKLYQNLIVTSVDNKIIFNCKYETFTFENNLPESKIKVFLNGKLLAFDEPPVIVSGRTMVPLRFFFEKIEATVEWVNETSEIIVKQKDKEFIFQIGNNKVSVDGEEVEVDAPPFIKNGRTFIPTRFLAENLGYNVGWDNDTASVIIDSK